MHQIPPLRVSAANEKPVNPDGDYVLYWMTAFRRTEWNFALQRAVEWAEELRKPLVVLEALRSGYPWASDRLHWFVIQGMADNARRLKHAPVCYYPYLEKSPGDGQGLLAGLAGPAAVVIGDDFPCFFLPRMIAATAERIDVKLELVDANGLLPMRAADKVFTRAYDFRRFLQKALRPHLLEFPAEDPFFERRLPRPAPLPEEITRRWPAAEVERLAEEPAGLADFPIDHDVSPAGIRGGAAAGGRRSAGFVADQLARYASDRSRVENSAASGLSPYLHFGHLSAHQIAAEVFAAADWSPDLLAERATGSSSGWWGAGEAVESFLDELITWRELGFNFCWQRDDYDQFDSLPQWAQDTLHQHARGPRPHTYTLAQFEAAATHNELWNAAQRQLLREGRIHNYLRMVWERRS